MGRYTGPSCRQCRREGTKLFLKGTKCFTEKCPVERRPYAPGQHGQSTARRRKASEYSKQLREKQKIKRIYGISEQQFRNTFEKRLVAARHHGPQPARRAREPSRQHRVPHGLRAEPQGRAPAHPPPPRRGQRRSRSTSRAISSQPGEEIRVRMKSREQVSVMAAMDQSSRGAPLSWIAVDQATRSAAGCSSARSARTFRSRRRNSWSSSCTRSNARVTAAPAVGTTRCNVERRSPRCAHG